MLLNTFTEVKNWINEIVIKTHFSKFTYEKVPANDAIVFSLNDENVKQVFGLGISWSWKSKCFKIYGIMLWVRLNKFEDFYAKERQNYFPIDSQIIPHVYSIKNKFPNEIWPINTPIDLIDEASKELVLIKVEEHIRTYGYIFTKYNTLYDVHAECNNFGNDLSLYNSYGEHFKHIYIKYFCEDKSYKRFAELVVEKKNKSISRYPIDSTDINMLGWKREVSAIEDLLQRIERGELKHLVGTF